MNGLPQVVSDLDDRVQGGLLGAWIGDALAMPVHWYYDRYALRRDYGKVTDFLKPHNPHLDSILWRSSWEAPSPELDILGDDRSSWGKRHIHYHQNLDAGENTLTGKLAAEVWDMLNQTGHYDAGEYLERYIGLLSSPQKHRDTYVEECHRGFFTNLGSGISPEKCGVTEKHIGGLVMMLPVALFFADEPERARTHALEHLALTHPGPEMKLAAEAILSLLLPTLHGASLAEVIREECARQRNPHFRFPFLQWLTLDDAEILGGRFSTACYVAQAVPSVIYLALKYADRPEACLIENTNLGGDNVHRGGVLGCLLGAENKATCWPERWRNQLLDPPRF